MKNLEIVGNNIVIKQLQLPENKLIFNVNKSECRFQIIDNNMFLFDITGSYLRVQIFIDEFKINNQNQTQEQIIEFLTLNTR